LQVLFAIALGPEQAEAHPERNREQHLQVEPTAHAR
jgi:hypothetical protein